MKIMITGGAGFIGSGLTEKLLQEKHKVAVLDNFTNFINNPQYYKTSMKLRKKLFQREPTKTYHMDICNKEDVNNAVKNFKPDIIVHLAGISMARVPENHVHLMVPINLQGTLNVLDAFEKSKTAQRIIYASSSMAYGHFMQSPQPEDMVLKPTNSYGACKAAGEFFVKLSKKDWVITRATSVYGFTDCANRVTQLLIDAAIAGRSAWVVKGESLDFTYVDDVVEGYMKCIFSTNALYETFNLSRGQSRPAADFANELKKYFPHFTFVVREPFGHQVYRGALDISKARTLLQYDPKYSMEEGILETLKLMKQYMKIKVTLPQ